MTDKLLNHMIKRNIINEEDVEIYRFGLEALKLKMFHYVSYLLIAIFCDGVAEFLLFFIAFVLLRKSAGGYHAKTKGGCYVLSCLTVILAIAIMKNITMENTTLVVGVLLLIIADIVIFRLAPLGNRNRELEYEEEKYFRKKTILLLILENISVLLLIWVNKEQHALSFVLAIVCQAILLLLQKGNDI